MGGSEEGEGMKEERQIKKEERGGKERGGKVHRREGREGARKQGDSGTYLAREAGRGTRVDLGVALDGASSPQER